MHDIQGSIRKHTRRTGFSVIAVFGDEDEPGFSYTVGLFETYRHPEVIIFGLPPRVSHAIVHSIVDKILDEGKTVELNKHNNDMLASYPVIFIPADKEKTDKYVFKVDEYYQDSEVKPEVIQMVWPDQAGLFPCDSGFDRNLILVQPLLGPLSSFEFPQSNQPEDEGQNQVLK